jgi:hypothetical protein
MRAATEVTTILPHTTSFTRKEPSDAARRHVLERDVRCASQPGGGVPVSPVTIGARALGVERNGEFTAVNTKPIPGGRLWPEAAATWLAMHAAFVADGGSPAEFRPGGPASSARSISQQQGFWHSQPPPAAFPGSSNHGWGIAVDCPFARAQAWLMRNAQAYGWSHDEGARVGEPWHFRYVGAPRGLLRKLESDPLAFCTASERRWIREYDALRTHGDAHRRRVLQRVMTEQRKRIWAAAQDGGWTRARKRRYAALRARTT